MTTEREQGRYKDYLHVANLQKAEQLIELGIALPSTLLIWRRYGFRRALRYLGGLSVALLIERIFIATMIRRIGPERSSVADLLTLSRGSICGMLAGLVTSGIDDRTGPSGWLSWSMSLLGVTATDWLDGPLARRAGPTRLGKVLDIEADSWLALWSGAGAVAWGNLPVLSLLPPVVRYIYLFLCFRYGVQPAGGGPWWGRVTGTAQMALFMAALAPVESKSRKPVLKFAALPISTIQLVSILTSIYLSYRDMMASQGRE